MNSLTSQKGYIVYTFKQITKHLLTNIFLISKIKTKQTPQSSTKSINRNLAKMPEEERANWQVEEMVQPGTGKTELLGQRPARSNDNKWGVSQNCGPNGISKLPPIGSMN